MSGTEAAISSSASSPLSAVCTSNDTAVSASSPRRTVKLAQDPRDGQPHPGLVVHHQHAQRFHSDFRQVAIDLGNCPVSGRSPSGPLLPCSLTPGNRSPLTQLSGAPSAADPSPAGAARSESAWRAARRRPPRPAPRATTGRTTRPVSLVTAVTRITGRPGKRRLRWCDSTKPSSWCSIIRSRIARSGVNVASGLSRPACGCRRSSPRTRRSPAGSGAGTGSPRRRPRAGFVVFRVVIDPARLPSTLSEAPPAPRQRPR